MALLHHQSLDGSEVLLVFDLTPVTARNTAGREYRRQTTSTIAFMILLKITLGAMWATLSSPGKRNLFNRAMKIRMNWEPVRNRVTLPQSWNPWAAWR